MSVFNRKRERIMAFLKKVKHEVKGKKKGKALAEEIYDKVINLHLKQALKMFPKANSIQHGDHDKAIDFLLEQAEDVYGETNNWDNDLPEDVRDTLNDMFSGGLS